MNKLTEKIELIANLLIIVVAGLIIVTLAQSYLSTSSASSIPSQSLRAVNQTQQRSNSPIEIEGVNFSEKPKTLILALQVGCHFCTESTPFYKRLIESVKDKQIKLLAVLPSNQESSNTYLNKLGITNLEIKQSPLSGIQVNGTPTLILTNEKGEIISSWVGKLTPEKEDEVISSL